MIGLVEGRRIRLRLVRIDDAEFILSLRLDGSLNRFLSLVDDNVEQQREWIRNSRSREDELYFVIEGKDGNRYGTVRIYEIRPSSFAWGSWVIRKDAPANVSIESALLIYETAFRKLGLPQSNFEVMKDNVRVVHFHTAFGAKIDAEDNAKYHFVYPRAAYENIRSKYLRYLPEDVLFANVGDGPGGTAT